MSFKSHFIATAIPYVNSKPHIGHAQEFILADSISRFHKSRGCEVVFQSGTDDNATKNALAAKGLSLSTQQFVDQNAEKFQHLLQVLNAKPDVFVRTSSEKHFQYVHQFLGALNSEDIYTATYSGLYCTGCEDFFNEGDLVNGLCPDHHKAPDHVEEQNVFFRLSRYQNQIIQLLESDTIKITPDFRKKEILSFARQGLSDISLSRSASRSQGWGIPFPGRSDQTVYVWIDALLNYLSGSLESWREDIYKTLVIGKNVWKFHAIYFPALLLSAGLPLPNEIVVHGFLTDEGTKISKSLGNGADPFEIVDRYGADALRFYLLAVLSFEHDADFIEKNLLSSYNSELANKLGNLASRVLTLAKGIELELSDWSPTKLPSSKTLHKEAFAAINEINSEINDLKPWELLKTGASKELKSHLLRWIHALREISFLLGPIIPEGAFRLSQSLSALGTEIKPLYPRR